MGKIESFVQLVVPELKWKQDGTGALMAYSQDFGLPKDVSWMQEAIWEIQRLRNKKVFHILVNKLRPGTVVPKHVDPVRAFPHGPLVHVERWHLPIETNPLATFWTEAEDHHHLELGFWHGPVKYWEPHSVMNLGKTDRIHLVVDLDG